METKTSKKPDTLQDSVEQFNDWYNTGSATLNEFYKKQASSVLGFYNNLFNSMLNPVRNNWGDSGFGFTLPFNGDGAAQSFFNPFSWMKAGENNKNYFSVYESFINQVTGYNQKLLNMLQSQLQQGQKDWITANEKYRQLVEERWEIARNMINNLNDAYTRQLDFSIQTNQKALSELSRQIDRALKSSSEFWGSYLKTGEADSSKESEQPKTAKKEMTKVA